MEKPGKSSSSFIISSLLASSLLAISLFWSSPVRSEGNELNSGGVQVSGIEEKQYSIDGYFVSEYRYRGTQVSGESLGDQDITGELRFDVTMPEKNRFEFHFFGTANGDLDGGRENQNFYPLEDITDTSSSWVYATLYEAHFDINLKRRTHVIALDEDLADKVTAIARAKHVPSAMLINKWLREKVVEQAKVAS